MRKVKEGPVRADLFGFLTSAPNAEVAAIHPKAMPVILTAPGRVGDVAGRAVVGGEGAAAAVAGWLAAHCAPGREGGFRGDVARYAGEWMSSASTPLSLDLPPMEAEAVDELPAGPGWQFEPKYDGFRCLAHRRGGRVHLQSKNQKPLERYFPEVARGIEEIAEDDFVLDGELVIAGGSFESLQLRLHPAESRIRKLALETPAELIVFDLLARSGISLLDRPLAERRRELEDFMAQAASSVLRLGEATDQEAVARDWLGREGLDGIVAKRLDLPYQSGERAMRKFKLWKTVDCVVAGLYRKRGTQAVEHLLLGLYDEEGLLNYVGRARIYEDAAEIGRLLEPLVGGRVSPVVHRAARAAGQARSGCRCRSSRSSSSRSAPITSPASTCATGRGCCAGGPTSRPRAARWIRSDSAWRRRDQSRRRFPAFAERLALLAAK